jgi:hypothetical protein
MTSIIGHRQFRQLLAVLLIAGNINIAYADGGDSTDGEWEFLLAPLFLWAQGIEGGSTIGPITAPLDITFKDALDNLDTTFTVHFEAKRNKLTLFGEYQYVSLAPEAVGPMGADLDISFKDTIAELGVTYWVFGTEKTNWEILGGGRYTKQKLNVEVDIEGAPSVQVANENWWVGFFGGRMSATLSEKWTFIARADYGLGSGGSNNQFNMNLMFDYRFRHWGSVFVGYKYLNYDFDNGKTGLDHYGYDASQQGPLVGLMIHW